jgi:hypothetical protein
MLEEDLLGAKIVFWNDKMAGGGPWAVKNAISDHNTLSGLAPNDQVHDPIACLGDLEGIKGRRAKLG